MKVISFSLRSAVILVALLEALMSLYLGHWMTSEYLRANASSQQALIAGGPAWIDGALFLLAGWSYWQIPISRSPLRIVAVVLAVIAAYDYLVSDNLVRSYAGLIHGDIVAIISASGIGLMVLGPLCAADFYVEKFFRAQRLRRLGL